MEINHKIVGAIFFSLMAFIMLFLGEKQAVSIMDFPDKTDRFVTSADLAEMMLDGREDVEIFNATDVDALVALAQATKLKLSDFESTKTRANINPSNINIIVAYDLALASRVVNFLNEHRILAYVLSDGLDGWNSYIKSEAIDAKILRGESLSNGIKQTTTTPPRPVRRSVVPSNSVSGGGC